jgi:hypothetical protein
MYYNLICIFLYALLFARNFILVKSGCYTSPALPLLNRNLYKWRISSILCCVESHQLGVFIGVPGAVTDLIKPVIR